MEDIVCKGCGSLLTRDIEKCPYCDSPNPEYGRVIKVDGNEKYNVQIDTFGNNRYCVASLTYAIFGLFMPVFVIFPIAGIVNALLGIGEVRKTHEKGKGLAIAGFIISLFSVIEAIFTISIILVAIGFFGV